MFARTCHTAAIVIQLPRNELRMSRQLPGATHVIFIAYDAVRLAHLLHH